VLGLQPTKFFVLIKEAKVSLALEAVRRIDVIFAIKREIKGQAAYHEHRAKHRILSITGVAELDPENETVG
jgi:hypothetical protein